MIIPQQGRFVNTDDCRFALLIGVFMDNIDGIVHILYKNHLKKGGDYAIILDTIRRKTIRPRLAVSSVKSQELIAKTAAFVLRVQYEKTIIHYEVTV